MTQSPPPSALLASLLMLFLVALLALPRAPWAGDAIQLKFGTLAPEGTPWADILFELKRNVEKDSGGRVQVRMYLGGQLGDERAMLEKMAYGQLTGGGFSTGGMSAKVPELQVLELPFLFRNAEEADFVMDAVVYADLRDALARKGLFLYCWAENGWVDFGNKTRPIRTPADLKGLKMFMQESDVQKALWETLSVSAVPLAVPEVLTSLQTGLVNAFTTTPIYATSAQWFTETRYWTDSDHSYQPAAVVFDLKFWNSLPQDLRDLMLSYKVDLQYKARSQVRGLDAGFFDGFKGEGIQIAKLTPQEREAFRLATTAVGPKLVQKGAFSQALLQKVTNGLSAFRKTKGG